MLAVADLFEAPRQHYMETYDIPKGYTSHTELLQDDEIDAVAVVLGHQLHHRLTDRLSKRREARAGREADGDQP